LTEELAFFDEQQCVKFITENSAPKDVFDDKADGLRFSCQKAGQLFEAAKTGAYRVDIKGQI
jgi:hypothetical protein